MCISEGVATFISFNNLDCQTMRRKRTGGSILICEFSVLFCYLLSEAGLFHYLSLLPFYSDIFYSILRGIYDAFSSFTDRFNVVNVKLGMAAKCNLPPHLHFRPFDQW